MFCFDGICSDRFSPCLRRCCLCCSDDNVSREVVVLYHADVYSCYSRLTSLHISALLQVLSFLDLILTCLSATYGRSRPFCRYLCRLHYWSFIAWFCKHANFLTEVCHVSVIEIVCTGVNPSFLHCNAPRVALTPRRLFHMALDDTCQQRWATESHPHHHG